MRAVISFSVPSQKKKQEIIKSAKKAGKNVSEFLLDMFDYQSKLITEEELIRKCKQAEKEYQKGRYYSGDLEDLIGKDENYIHGLFN